MMRCVLALSVMVGVTVGAAPPASETTSADRQALIERFLAREDPPPISYRAFRRLEARNERFDAEGWMEVMTELTSDRTFSWTVVEEGGSSYIRGKVLVRALEAERDAIARNDPESAALSRANYAFDARRDAASDVPDGLARVPITPKRKDVMLVDGQVWLAVHDGDLLQVDGRLARSPSFWTRTVDVMRRYARLAGVRVPVEMTSTADVRLAGTSTFRMTYSYETINGVPVTEAGNGAARPMR